METLTRYSPEMLEPAAWMVLKHQYEHGSQLLAISSIASKIGCAAQTLCNWVRPRSSVIKDCD